MKHLLGVCLLIFAAACSTPPEPKPQPKTKSGETKKLKLSDVKTKFACNMAMWFKGDHISKMEQAKAMGFKGVEFWGLNQKKVDEITKASKELDIEVVQFTGSGRSICDAKNHEAFVKDIERSCKWAKQMGCKMFTVVGHRYIKGIDKETQIANYTKAMKLVKPIVEKHQVMIIIEPFNPVNHGKCILNGSQLAVKICREVNSKMIKINWDFYHMQLTEGDLVDYLKKGFDQVGYIQLADTPGRNQPGTGELNYKFIIKELHKLGYRGYVGVECRPRGTHEKALQQLLENSY